jgi:hypothetical protein
MEPQESRVVQDPLRLSLFELAEYFENDLRAVRVMANEMSSGVFLFAVNVASCRCLC